MELKEILTKIDHTALAQTTTDSDIKTLIDEAISFNAASVCIPPCYVALGNEYGAGRIKICTVIGFPNGYSTTAAKLFEANEAIKSGAQEIDMVINNCDVKNGRFDLVENEILQLKKVCGNSAILKVIIEACLLTDAEKIKLCDIVTRIKADYIKTSTGFAKGGATKEDVILFKKYIGKDVKIKAAGGIRTLSDAEEYVELGCDRIGSSAIIKALSTKKV